MPYFKTNWNIDLLSGHNIISHLGVYRRAVLERVGDFAKVLKAVRITMSHCDARRYRPRSDLPHTNYTLPLATALWGGFVLSAAAAGVL